MIGAAPICMQCKHYIISKTGLICDAFPEGIPDLILIEGNDHREPVQGDSGIMFEKGPAQYEEDKV